MRFVLIHKILWLSEKIRQLGDISRDPLRGRPVASARTHSQRTQNFESTKPHSHENVA
jgi:hypothetical protein